MDTSIPKLAVRGMAAAIPRMRLMGRAYSESHFILGSYMSRPQMTMTRADTAITQTGTMPEVAV